MNDTKLHDVKPHQPQAEQSMRWLSVATAIAGISGFAVVIIPGRAFGKESTISIEFLAYWGLFFTITGIITGLTQETTRAVTTALETQKPRDNYDDSHGINPVTTSTTKSLAQPIIIGLWIALVTMVAVIILAPLWSPRILSQHNLVGIILMAVGLASYTVQATIAGLISASRLWNRYALLITLDSVSRMVLAIVAWLFGWKLVAFLVVTVLGAASWLVLVTFSSQVRETLRLRADVSTKQFLRRAGFAMAASGATAVLITGFPTLAKFTHPDATPIGEVSVNVVSYGVILTRAPLLVPLQQFLSALVVRFVQRRNKPLRALSQPFLLIWSVGLLGSFAAWLIGPWLMVAVLGDAYVISGRSLALFTLGATCTASLMITGAAAMSIEKHQYYLWGWATATLVGICFLASPLSLENGAWLALCIGPLCGLVVHMVGIFTARTTSSSLSTPVA